MQHNYILDIEKDLHTILRYEKMGGLILNFIVANIHFLMNLLCPRIIGRTHLPIKETSVCLLHAILGRAHFRRWYLIRSEAFYCPCRKVDLVSIPDYVGVF